LGAHNVQYKEREEERRGERGRREKEREPEIPTPIHTHFHFPRAHVLQTFLISEVDNYVFNTSIEMLC